MEDAQVRLEGLAMTIKSFFISSHAPTLYPTLPPWTLFKILPPPAEPRVLPPPIHDATLAKPFNISSEVYNNALHVSVPITFAIGYALVVTYLNGQNKKRDNKPWAFSKSSVFYVLVLLHNVFLTIYSAWTCIGMINAIRHTWPGSEGEHKLARAADALCKLHGPRGYGSAATYGSDNQWSFTDRLMKLDAGLPDTTDVGRLWNEGLAFYGWLFYLSKFYEVLDTFIILAKGKNTAFFQTYHHAGALFCVWSGIRYMSPPIWMFVIVNSGIHTLMYAYYTLNHLGIRVAQGLKSTLTTLQIVQFVFGATYAIAHLFIAYDIPVETPYLFVHNLSSALPTAASSVSSAIASADIGSWLKKAALRAAGEEGLAENVRNTQGQTFGIDAVHTAEVERAQEEVRYKTQYRTVKCLDTPGETFAILLNFLYLFPLTVMFVNFFIRTYLKKSRSSAPPSTTENVKQSGKAAAKDLKQELEEAMATEQNDLGTEESDVPSNVSSQTSRIKKGTEDVSNKATGTVHQANEVFQDKLQEATDAVSEKVNDLNKRRHEHDDQGTEDLRNKAADAIHQAKYAFQDKFQGATDAVSEKIKDLNKKRNENADQIESKAMESKDASGNKLSEDTTENAPKNPQDQPPNLKPILSTDSSKKKPQSRSASPQKKTQLPRPSSQNRSRSPAKKDPAPKEEEKLQVDGDVVEEQEPKKQGTPSASDGPTEGPEDESNEKPKKELEAVSKKDQDKPEPKPSSLDESAYEINPDELKDEGEKKAEEEMQPKLE
ncbi:MAG: hypothetical protein Q9184_003030 [Pyrenodesmia sp. 2 TL-2023]